MSDRPPRVFGYPRASTKKQVESPETQKDMIKKYAVFNGLGDVTFFVDAATSGKVSWEERDAGKELFRQLRRGDHVVLTKLDRAFRKLSDCVTVLEKFERMGVKLHICNLMGGAIDLSSPMGRFMIHILAAFAELERAGLRFAFHSWGSYLEIIAAAQLGICWPENVVEWLEYPLYRKPGQKIMYEFPLAEEILKEPLQIVEGELIVPRGPGLGVEIDESVIERYPWKPGPWSTFTLISPPGTWAVHNDHSVQWVENG